MFSLNATAGSTIAATDAFLLLLFTTELLAVGFSSIDAIVFCDLADSSNVFIFCPVAFVLMVAFSTALKMRSKSEVKPE